MEIFTFDPLSHDVRKFVFFPYFNGTLAKHEAPTKVLRCTKLHKATNIDFLPHGKLKRCVGLTVSSSNTVTTIHRLGSLKGLLSPLKERKMKRRENRKEHKIMCTRVVSHNLRNNFYVGRNICTITGMSVGGMGRHKIQK